MISSVGSVNTTLTPKAQNIPNHAGHALWFDQLKFDPEQRPAKKNIVSNASPETKKYNSFYLVIKVDFFIVSIFIIISSDVP
jgi:hypothetical protein